jgi:exosortase
VSATALPRRRAALDAAIVLAGLAAVYAPLAPELVRDWMRSGDFSHGFVVPFVSAWLLWVRRDRLRREIARPWLPGAALLLAGVAQYLVGVAAVEFYLQRTSAIVMLGGCILLLFGPGVARHCVFPVAFLAFAVPPPTLVMNWVAFPLQLQASRVTEALVAAVGIEVARTGNVIHLEGISLEVARACSGLRSLVTLLALGAILAEGSLLPGRGGPRSAGLRGLVFLGVIPVAIAVNSLRVALTAVVAATAGVVLVSGWAHEAMGLAMFVVSMGLLLAWRKLLRWLESSLRGPSPVS